MRDEPNARLDDQLSVQRLGEEGPSLGSQMLNWTRFWHERVCSYGNKLPSYLVIGCTVEQFNGLSLLEFGHIRRSSPSILSRRGAIYPVLCYHHSVLIFEYPPINPQLKYQVTFPAPDATFQSSRPTQLPKETISAAQLSRPKLQPPPRHTHISRPYARSIGTLALPSLRRPRHCRRSRTLPQF